jgi:hypothetical protein
MAQTRKVGTRPPAAHAAPVIDVCRVTRANPRTPSVGSVCRCNKRQPVRVAAPTATSQVVPGLGSLAVPSWRFRQPGPSGSAPRADLRHEARPQSCPREPRGTDRGDLKVALGISCVRFRSHFALERYLGTHVFSVGAATLAAATVCPHTASRIAPGERRAPCGALPFFGPCVRCRPCALKLARLACPLPFYTGQTRRMTIGMGSTCVGVRIDSLRWLGKGTNIWGPVDEHIS